MKNFKNYKAAKYADTEKYVEVEDGIYQINGDGDYVTSLSFELEMDNDFECDGSPSDIPQAPFEDLLDEFSVYVSDFYEEENTASEITCYQEFGSPHIEDVQEFRTIIGKRFYAMEDPENEDCYITRFEDEGQTAEPTPAPIAVDEPEDEESGITKIEGETNLDDFEFEESENGAVVITRYRGEDKEVVVPSEIKGKPVRKIGFNAFANLASLESVVIPDGVEEIDCYAFEDSKKLKNIVIPESVKTIWGRAFKNTAWLKKLRAKDPLVVVNGVVIDGKNCEGDVVIPEGVRMITSDAFNGCKATSVVISEGVTEISHRAFQECKQLTSVTIPGTVTIIGERAFDDCKKLESMTVPDSVEELGDEPFAGTPWLANKRKEAPLVIIGKYLLDGRGCKGEVEIPDGVTHICQKAFYYCRELTSVTIPRSVTEIGRYAFQGCSGLASVELVWGVKKISEGAFWECTALEEIDLPWSVTEIGEGAFRNCESLKEIDIDKGITEIAAGTFYGCASLDHIKIPSSVTKIESGAFKKCASMRWVSLPDDLKTIGSDCFRECMSLEEADIPRSVETIGRDAYKGCTAIQKIGFYNNVTEIGVGAFMDCTALEEAYLPDSLTVLYNYTFANCSALEKVQFGDELKAIGTSAFHGCEALKELDLPDTLVQINDLAFAGCSSLREVKIPKSVVRFDLSAFRSCRCTVKYKGKEYSLSVKEVTTSVEALNNEDIIVADIFGRAAMVRVISTGDNQFDKDGQHKPDGFALSEKEIAVLNDFLENVKLADFIGEITDYCNERYEENAEAHISEKETTREIRIGAIAVNVCEDNGEDDPEIAFVGDCDCDEEGGICIGFRGGELVGIQQQDWLL